MSVRDPAEYFRGSEFDSMEWQDRAACRNSLDDHFPIGKRGRMAKSTWAKARANCRNCEVIRQCKEEYTREPIPEFGMFFGMTPKERRELRDNEL